MAQRTICKYAAASVGVHLPEPGEALIERELATTERLGCTPNVHTGYQRFGRTTAGKADATDAPSSEIDRGLTICG